MIEKLGGLKLPPFKYAVSGPSLCPGHLYRVDSRSDEHRAEFFAVTALAAVTDLPAIGWDDAPGRVVIVGDVDQINNFIQPKIRLLAQAWGVALPDPGRMIFVARSEPVQQLFAPLDTLRGEGPFSLVIIDQMDMLEGPVGTTAKGAVVEHPLHVEQCRLLTRLDGNPAVVVGQKPHRQIAHPIIVDELRPAQTEDALNTVRTPVSIKIGGIAHHGYFEVENGLIRVSYRGSTKATQLGGSSRTPRVLARLILAELVREALGHNEAED